MCEVGTAKQSSIRCFKRFFCVVLLHWTWLSTLVSTFWDKFSLLLSWWRFRKAKMMKTLMKVGFKIGLSQKWSNQSRKCSIPCGVSATQLCSGSSFFSIFLHSDFIPLSSCPSGWSPGSWVRRAQAGGGDGWPLRQLIGNSLIYVRALPQPNGFISFCRHMMSQPRSPRQRPPFVVASLADDLRGKDGWREGAEGGDRRGFGGLFAEWKGDVRAHGGGAGRLHNEFCSKWVFTAQLSLLKSPHFSPPPHFAPFYSCLLSFSVN